MTTEQKIIRAKVQLLELDADFPDDLFDLAIKALAITMNCAGLPLPSEGTRSTSWR
jgi:hypothetical protein